MTSLPPSQAKKVPYSMSSASNSSFAEKDIPHHNEAFQAKMSAHVEEEDVARVLAEHAGDAPYTEAEERALVRKIDLMLMPIMIITVFLQTTDKGIYGTGATFGMGADLGLFVTKTIKGKATTLTGNYSNASMIFYPGYILGSYPLSLLAQKYPIAKMAGIYVILWAIILLCQAAVTDYKGALIQRFFLGVMESGVSPAYTIMTSMWYTKREQAFRLPLWYSCGFSGIAISYFISYGLMHAVPEHIKKWQMLFLFYGSITFAWGVFAFCMLPDSPTTTKWFSERERYIAIERLRSNQDSVKNTHVKKDQIFEALTDIKVWMVCIIIFLVLIPNGLTSTFIPVVVKALGFNSYQSLLLSAPAFIVAGVTGVLLGWFATSVNNGRVYGTMFALLPCLVGGILLWKAPHTNTAARLVGIYLNTSFAGAFTQILAFIPSNTGGTTKKSVASSLAFICYSCGNILGPLALKSTEAPNYPTGFKLNVAAIATSIGLLAVYRVVLMRENKRRDALADAGHVDHSFEDHGDRQNLSFRYAM